MKTTSYKTYLLIGFPHFGHTEGKVIARWEYAPPSKEFQKAIDDASKEYDGFVLVSPCGEMIAGNYTGPDPTDYCYG